MDNSVATNTKTGSMEKSDEASFAHGFNYYKIFWIFLIGSFFGVIVETIWCRVTNGFFENRTALILEPLNPIYGIGAVIISLLFISLRNKSNLTIFLSCMFVGGSFEWICSFLQELIYGTVSWKYYKDTIGIFGRTSLVYSVFWGVLGIFWIKIIYPFLSSKIEKIPNKIGKILTVILSIVISIDVIFSSLAVLRWQDRLNGIKATNNVQVFYDTYFDNQTMKNIYPHMVKAKQEI